MPLKSQPAYFERMMKEIYSALDAEPTYPPEVRKAGGEVPIADQIALMHRLIPLLLLDKFKDDVPEAMLEKVRNTTSITRLRWWLSRLETAKTLADMRIGTSQAPRRSLRAGTRARRGVSRRAVAK